MSNNRFQAAEAYARALRTGEHFAAQDASKYLATDIVMQVDQRSFQGYDEALQRITGNWPLTPVYKKGDWGTPREANGQVKIDAQMQPVGAGPTEVNLTFDFNDADEIQRVELENVIGQPLVETDVLPGFIKGRINNALSNDTPMSVGYVDQSGRPKLSLRGSVQAYSDTQLSIWARSAETGIAAAIANNPQVTLLYRDNPSRTTLTFQGNAHVDSSDEVRKRVFDATPEVEQNHEAWTTGAAVIIDLEQVDGATPRGRVRMRRTAS